jgi:hypothetical protein
MDNDERLDTGEKQLKQRAAFAVIPPRQSAKSEDFRG